MTTLYVAGPMRGIPEFNFPGFFEAEGRLTAAGYDVINPAAKDTSEGFDPKGLTGNEDLSELGFSLREALAWDTTMIATQADGIATLTGWTASKGAQAEVALAKALGLPRKSVDLWVIEANQNLTAEVDQGLAEWEKELLKAGFPKFEPLAAEEWDEDEDEDEDEVAPGLRAMVLEVRAAAEERVTSATGGEKGRKSEELGSIDPLALRVLAEVSGFGARKYAAFNYLKGYDWSLSFNALQRHALAFWAGEDTDPESGLPHAAHAAWHGLALTSFLQRGLGTDDRFKQP